MSDPTPSRRFALLLVLTVVIGITNCAPRIPKVNRTLCNKGNGSPSRPLICVDNRTLAASPNSAYVYDVEPGEKVLPDGRKEASSRPVMVHWLAREGGNLGVEFADKSCTEAVRCDGNGHCFAKVKRLDTTRPRRCAYTLNLDGRVSDPDLIVNPCCWLIDEPVPPLDLNVNDGFAPKY